MTKRMREIKAIYADLHKPGESLKACARRLSRYMDVAGLICRVWLFNKRAANKG